MTTTHLVTDIIMAAVTIGSGIGWYVSNRYNRIAAELISELKRSDSLNTIMRESMEREIALLKGLVSAYAPEKTANSEYIQSAMPIVMKLIKEVEDLKTAKPFNQQQNKENETEEL